MENAQHAAIAELSRCVACYTRLQVVWLAMKTGVITPGKLAEELVLSVPAAAAHLRELCRNGLFADAFIGNRHEYRLLPGKSGDLAGEMVAFLRETLDGESFDERPPAKAIVLFSAATGFTYSRRIAILKLLDATKQSTPDLASTLKLPGVSVARHLKKLQSRGYVKSEQRLGVHVYEAASPKTSIHRRYGEIVRAAW